MNFRVKFDKTDIKICLDKIECSENKHSPGQAAFFEVNLDYLYAPYLMFPTSTMSLVNPINKVISDYRNRFHLKGTYESLEGKPGVIPATGNDIYNYIARYGMANFQIQTVMKLSGKLDPKKLLKAVKLSVAAEPVFGCRFIENQPAYWRPLDDIEKTMFCTFEEAGNPDESVQRFLESPLDMDRDPMVKLKLIRSGQHDTLCVKINHTCCDGTGVKEYLKLLSDIYTRIETDNGIYVPVPSIRTRKDQDRLFSSLGIKDPLTAGDPLQEIPKTLWAFPWQPGRPDVAQVSVCKLPQGHIDILSKYAKSKGATINDIIVTAFYRAMFETSQPFYGVPLDISMTVDLRRYLPEQKTDAIRNFSGGFITRLARVAGETFEGTLLRVMAMMSKVKSNRPGLLSAIGLERVERDDFHQTISFYRTASQLLMQCAGYIQQCSPVLSNLGNLDKSLWKFGDAVVTDAYIVPPAICAPGLLLCIGSYNNIITMSVSYYQSQVQRENIEKLLGLIKKELMDVCKY